MLLLGGTRGWWWRPGRAVLGVPAMEMEKEFHRLDQAASWAAMYQVRGSRLGSAPRCWGGGGALVPLPVPAAEGRGGSALRLPSRLACPPSPFAEGGGGEEAPGGSPLPYRAPGVPEQPSGRSCPAAGGSSVG